MSDRLTIRIDHDTKTKLNQIAYRKGFTLTEAVRKLINREVGSDPLVCKLDELKKIIQPLSDIDFGQVLYHLSRASIAPVAYAQLQNREAGDQLNETVKSAAEKLAAKMIARTN